MFAKQLFRRAHCGQPAPPPVSTLERLAPLQTDRANTGRRLPAQCLQASPAEDQVPWLTFVYQSTHRLYDSQSESESSRANLFGASSPNPIARYVPWERAR